MFKFVALFALLAAVTVSAADPQWAEFKAKFGKSYASPEEEALRQRVFAENMDKAKRWNAEEGQEIFGMTKFSDIDEDEFRALYLSPRPRPVPENPTVATRNMRTVAASSYDWRDASGVVTDVKDQAQCGSCWAFSATETIESGWALQGNTLTEFSPEQIVQCDSTSYGCDGGWTEHAFNYVVSAGGMATEADYPYTSGNGVTGQCKSDFTVSGGSITGYAYATTPCTSMFCSSQDEDEMAANLADNMPLSVCVDASKWSLYTGGVMTSSSCSSSYFKQDHCVQAVGYNNKDSTGGYWMVRNSWAEDWGEDGYIYLAFGDNTCGVANDANFVTF